MTADHQHVSVRQGASDRPNGHRFVTALVDPDDLSGLDSRVDGEPRRQAFQVAGDPLSVRAKQTCELDAARILAEPVFDRDSSWRSGGSARDGKTVLGNDAVHPRQHIGRGLPVDEGREQQNANHERNGNPSEGCGADEIRKVHGE